MNLYFPQAMQQNNKKTSKWRRAIFLCLNKQLSPFLYNFHSYLLYLKKENVQHQQNNKEISK